MGMTSFVLNTSRFICGKLTWLQKACLSVTLYFSFRKDN